MTADHGSLVPVTLALKCDRRGCLERLDLARTCTGVEQEIYGSRMLQAEAEQLGWYVTRDRGEERDLCPGCAPHGAQVGRMR